MKLSTFLNLCIAAAALLALSSLPASNALAAFTEQGATVLEGTSGKR